jgi:hypothetical protein
MKFRLNGFAVPLHSKIWAEGAAGCRAPATQYESEIWEEALFARRIMALEIHK